MSTRGFEVVKRFENSDIKLPSRSTKFSAGYDFYAPEDIEVPSHLKAWATLVLETDKNKSSIIKPYCIKTGIKAWMDEDEVLQLYSRSSAPIKLGLVIANSVGIIDSDYYDNPDNEGEIGFLVYNLTLDTIHIKKDERIGQGIFTEFLLTDNDITEGVRIGGYGSTD